MPIVPRCWNTLTRNRPSPGLPSAQSSSWCCSNRSFWPSWRRIPVIATRSSDFSGSGTLRGTSFPLIRKTGGSPTLRCTSEAPCFAAARRISFSSKRSRSFRRRLAGRHDPALRKDLLRQIAGHLRMLLEEQAGVLAPLPDPLPADRVPRAALLDDVLLHPEVKDVALPGDPFPVEDVELRLAERRGELVFHHLDPVSYTHL